MLCRNIDVDCFFFSLLLFLCLCVCLQVLPLAFYFKVHVKEVTNTKGLAFEIFHQPSTETTKSNRKKKTKSTTIHSHIVLDISIHCAKFFFSFDVTNTQIKVIASGQTKKPQLFVK